MPCKGTIVPLFIQTAAFFRNRLKSLIFIAAGLSTASALAQSSSQRLFALMSARFAVDDSLRQAAIFSYELHLASTFYMKDDSAQIAEDWRLVQTPDSIRAQLVSRQTTGKDEVAKQYASPLQLASAKRGKADPLLAPIREILQRIKKDSKAQIMIDGQTAGRNGAPNYVLRFLANDRAGSLWVNVKTAALERIEWAYGKSIGLSSSAEKSSVEFAPVLNDMAFPVRLVFNERNRALLRRTGSYTEIEIKNFKREEMP
jgi:hypothetical protein